MMNKYHIVLSKILSSGRFQNNNKGRIQFLPNYVLRLRSKDLLDIFEGHTIAKNKLSKELDLFEKGERLTEKYRELDITWWVYCGPILVNSYPTYFEKLPGLISRINLEKRSSKNYVLFLGNNETESNQQPCLSLIQFQIINGKLHLSAYQRSSDASLGLPSDIYHLYLISRKVGVPLKSITLFLANVHIYENNIPHTLKLLEGDRTVKFNLNV